MELVVNTENGLVTSSRMVAEHFGMQHKNVLQAISTKINSAENSAQLNNMYFETTYKDASGKANREVLMNRDGFSLLAMGFTGAKALQFQLDFINEFNRMEQVLKQQQEIPTSPMDFIRVMFEAVEKQDQQVKQIVSDVEFLKSEVKITSQQASALGQLVGRKVHESMKKHDFFGSRQNKRMLFKEINSDIKKYAKVYARCEIKASQFDDVYAFILDWEPSYLIIKQLEWK